MVIVGHASYNILVPNAQGEWKVNTPSLMRGETHMADGVNILPGSPHNRDQLFYMLTASRYVCKSFRTNTTQYNQIAATRIFLEKTGLPSDTLQNNRRETCGLRKLR